MSYNITHNHQEGTIVVTLSDGRKGWPTAQSLAESVAPTGSRVEPGSTTAGRFRFTVHPGITLTRHQLEAWAGRTLTDDEVGRLDDAIPNSSIPDAVAEISFGITGA